MQALDFKTADFHCLTRGESIAKCREMAREASRLAVYGNAEKRAQYSDLARRWSALADEMVAQSGEVDDGSS